MLVWRGRRRTNIKTTLDERRVWAAVFTYAAPQRQTAVTAYFESKQLLLFAFALHYAGATYHSWSREF